MDKLIVEADAFLRSHGYDHTGQSLKTRPKKSKATGKPQPFVRIISTPMGGMARRPWR